jgi:hypothetical protein
MCFRRTADLGVRHLKILCQGAVIRTAWRARYCDGGDILRGVIGIELIPPRPVLPTNSLRQEQKNRTMRMLEISNSEIPPEGPKEAADPLRM